MSTYNGSCFEVARLREDRVGVRDTKDKGSGPVLIFNQSEWNAFLSGAKAGEFDSVLRGSAEVGACYSAGRKTATSINNSIVIHRHSSQSRNHAELIYLP